jgi:hypothetical protein
VRQSCQSAVSDLRAWAVTDDFPDLPDVAGEEREAISLWVKTRLEESERAHLARIEALRTAGEHPSPIYARFVRLSGELGLSKNLAAKQLGITVTTLDKHYAEDYDMGKAEILSAIAANMNRKAISATDPNAAKVGMRILESRGGEEWAPATRKLEMSSKKDAPPVIDSSKLTIEQRAQLRAMIEHVQNGGESDAPVDSADVDPIIE